MLSLQTKDIHPKTSCGLFSIHYKMYYFSSSSAETSTPTLPNGLPMVLALGQQQLVQAATLEHLREKLEKGACGTSEGPEKNNMARLAEEHQRLMQQAFQQNLLAMASHFSPMNHLKPSVNHGELRPSTPL